MKNIWIVGVVIIGIVAFLILLGSGLSPGETPYEVSSPQNLPQPPGENASEEEREAFFDAIVRMAVETEIIAIDSSCIFSPMVIKIERGASLVVKNNDSLEHVVSTFIDQGLTIPGQDSGSIEVLSPEGVYEVECDGMKKGFILVSS